MDGNNINRIRNMALDMIDNCYALWGGGDNPKFSWVIQKLYGKITIKLELHDGTELQHYEFYPHDTEWVDLMLAIAPLSEWGES